MAEQAYLDESGIHDGAEACIVAGFFGKKGPWRRLDVGWRNTLRRFSVPLHKFHANPVIHRTGFFKGWSSDQHEDFLRALGETVAGCHIHPVCYGVFVEDFFRFSLEERRFLTGGTWDGNRKRFLSTGCPSKPYFVAFNECLKVVTSYTPMCERANFFFGTDRPVAGYARSLFVDLKEKPTIVSTERFGTIGFPLASETPRLQVADLFSYLSYQHMLDRKADGKWNSQPRGVLLALLRNRKSPYDTSYRTEELLRKMISHVGLSNSTPVTTTSAVQGKSLISKGHQPHGQ
jgi:hypothetical protein